MKRLALRGRLLDFMDDPALAGAAACCRYFDDGILLIENGRIVEVGEAAQILEKLGDATLVDHRPHLIMPGFIDTHLHFPQTQVIASYGAQLLEWLQKYTFVEEQKFADTVHADRHAAFFLDELARNGTTTAAVYCSVHAQSADSLFAESHRRNMRMVAGKVMMDRGAPDALLDTAQRGYDDSKALIARWHGRGRQLYAVSPRFALTSTREQLDAAGALIGEHPDCYLQTHLAENRAEIAAALALYPDARDYTHIYEKAGLLGEKSLFGHCIHLSERELGALHDRKSVAVFCPTSNLFIGSGLFDLAKTRAAARPVRVGVATDIGGGTSYSMLQTLAEAYKVLQLQNQNFPALDAFYAITRGNARALSLDGVIGSFDTGAEADLVVLNARATPSMAHRMETVETLEEELFVLMMLGDDRAVAETYVMGEGVAC